MTRMFGAPVYSRLALCLSLRLLVCYAPIVCKVRACAVFLLNSLCLIVARPSFNWRYGRVSVTGQLGSRVTRRKCQFVYIYK